MCRICCDLLDSGYIVAQLHIPLVFGILCYHLLTADVVFGPASLRVGGTRRRRRTRYGRRGDTSVIPDGGGEI